MRNRIRLLVIALLAVLSLAACGNEGSGTATVNMKQLQQAMLAAAPSLSETASTTGDAADAKETFSYVSDLPYDKVENFLLSYSTTGKADEIAVIAVKDPASGPSISNVGLRASPARRSRSLSRSRPTEPLVCPARETTCASRPPRSNRCPGSRGRADQSLPVNLSWAASSGQSAGWA